MIRLSALQRFACVSLLACLAQTAFAGSSAHDSADTDFPLVHTRHDPDGLPIVVVVAQRDAVMSDFLVPYGVLSQSGAARVIAVNVDRGPLETGAFKVTPDMTAAQFDQAYPGGADYVIVPATADRHAEELMWLRKQRTRGAAMVSICDGVSLLAEIGALDGRTATGHWASLRDRRKLYPKISWKTNVRYVADGDVASSAGVSAALPISLALVGSIAGPQIASETASRLGVIGWDATHDSDMFKVRPDDLAVHQAEILLSLKPRLRGAACTVAVDCPRGIMMNSMPGALSQVMTNLVMNALLHGFAGRKGGAISIHGEVDETCVILRVSDNGIGMNAADLGRMFDPYFTTKRGSGGSGLGAHIVLSQVTEVMRGTIQVSSWPGAGLHVQMRLPRTLECKG